MFFSGLAISEPSGFLGGLFSYCIAGNLICLPSGPTLLNVLSKGILPFLFHPILQQ